MIYLTKQPASHEDSSGQAGAIEVTPAMIKAGVEVLRSIYDYELSPVSEGSLERAATEVFQTMAKRLS